MHMAVSFTQRHLVAVVIFQSFKKTGLCSYHMVVLEMVE
jgi:hypothetical protein